MNLRNLFVRTLFDAVEDQKLSIPVRNRRAISAIEAIVVSQSIHESFKHINPELKIDLSDEVNLDVRNEDGNTVLIVATHCNYSEIVNKLIESKRCNLDLQTENGETALMFAVFNNHQGIAHELIESNRCNLNLQAKHGHTALTLAIGYKRPEIAHKLIESKRCNLDLEAEDGRTALMLAVSQRDTAITTALLEAKADINYLNHQGISVLDHAIEKNLSMVSLLLKYNAKVYNFAGLHTFLLSQDQNNPLVSECLKELLVDSENTAALVPDPIQQENAKAYSRKLILLHDAYKILFSYLLEESFSVFFPHGIRSIISDYDGRFFKPPAHVPPMRLFNSVTADLHLDRLKDEILRKTKRARPELFTPIIKEINDTIAIQRTRCCT